ncbi:SMR family transporter [Candidatus Magnetaquicoccus inordinatus]|uniref:SMR family transporter n=1 Tax=Candidatus Magnetaquicoccus inordinatus TaxID=2496818 RepID=UPI00102C71AF|nr:SMR family transporter [Candidatus Magnetaquicoccus inordinatus]
MKPQLFALLLVLLAALIEGFAHVCLKKSVIERAKKWYWLTIGILAFVIEAGVYTMALQELPIALAYTLGALAFVATALFSLWLLDERIVRRQWLGLAFIVLGCSLVAW